MVSCEEQKLIKLTEMKLALLISLQLLASSTCLAQDPSGSKAITTVQSEDELSQAKEFYGEYYRILYSDLTPYVLTGSDDALLEKVNIAEVIKRREVGKRVRLGIAGTDMILEILPTINYETNEIE